MCLEMLRIWIFGETGILRELVELQRSQLGFMEVKYDLHLWLCINLKEYVRGTERILFFFVLPRKKHTPLWKY